MKRLLSIFLFLAMTVMTFAAEPAGRLFRFERSTNKNYICYDVNLKNGVLDDDEPITVYWIGAADGSRSKLSWLERKMAFGYKVVKCSGNTVTIRLNPSDKMPITVCKKGGKWVALAAINGKTLQMTKMFAQMQSAMKCAYVDVYGVNTATGKAERERINNK